MSYTSLGKLNWANLAAYAVQPSDMELNQTYSVQRQLAVLSGSRTKGVIVGGVLSVVSGMQIKVSSGVCLFPDGTIASWPDLTAILANGSSLNPRFDRVELSYSLTNNTTVQDINGNNLTLDKLYTVAINVIQGTPAASPTVPAATSSNVGIGYVQVPTSAGSVNSGNLNQIVDSGLDVSALALGNLSGFIRYNLTSSMLQWSNNGTQWSAFGSGGGGGGGGANWRAVDGAAPVEAFEYGEKELLFSQGAQQAASLFIKIPTGYLSGAPLKLKLGLYSPSSSGNWQFQTTATLIRQGTDAINSTANQYLSTNSFFTNVTALQYVNRTYDLSSSVGLINGLSMNAGDLILVQIQRITPASGTEDTADVRMIPSSTEITFS